MECPSEKAGDVGGWFRPRGTAANQICSKALKSYDELPGFATPMPLTAPRECRAGHLAGTPLTGTRAPEANDGRALRSGGVVVRRAIGCIALGVSTAAVGPDAVASFRFATKARTAAGATCAAGADAGAWTGAADAGANGAVERAVIRNDPQVTGIDAKSLRRRP